MLLDDRQVATMSSTGETERPRDADKAMRFTAVRFTADTLRKIKIKPDPGYLPHRSETNSLARFQSALKKEKPPAGRRRRQTPS